MSGFQQFTRAPRLDEFTSDYVLFQAGRLTYPAANTAFQPMGNLYSNVTPGVLAANTTEQTLATFTLPANALDVDGRKILITAFFLTGANTHSKECKLYFGSTSITTGAVTTASVTPYLQLVVTRASNAQFISSFGLGGTTGIVPQASSNLAAETMSAAIIIKATGQVASGPTAADIQVYEFSVQYMN